MNLDVIPAKFLKDVAVRIAVLDGIGVYDAIYVSASLLSTPLPSFDRKTCDAAKGLGISLLKG